MNRKGKITIELDYEVIPDYSDIMLEISHPLLDGSMHCIYSNMKEVESALEELVEGDEDGDPLPPHVDDDVDDIRVYKYVPDPVPVKETKPEPKPEPIITPAPVIPKVRKQANTSAEQIAELTEKGIGLVMTLNAIFSSLTKKGR